MLCINKRLYRADGTHGTDRTHGTDGRYPGGGSG